MTIELVRALPAWLMWLAFAGLVGAAYAAGYIEGIVT